MDLFDDWKCVRDWKRRKRAAVFADIFHRAAVNAESRNAELKARKGDPLDKYIPTKEAHV